MNQDKGSVIGPESLLTSYQVGALLQVNPSSINKWVKDGRIPAFRTPGGHRRIRASDLVAFLRAHEMPVPGTLQSADSRRLLLVDGENAALEALQRALAPHAARLELRICHNGIDALVEVGSFKPHIVILDMLMPGLDGIEVCRRLRQNEDTQEIEIYLTSATLTPAVEDAARAAGASGCLQKPVEADAILGQLSRTAVSLQ